MSQVLKALFTTGRSLVIFRCIIPVVLCKLVEECVGFLDRRKRAKLQWIQDPRQSNVDILNNVRREVRHFRKKKKVHLRDKIEELETNSKIQNIRDLYRDINYFKKG